MEIRQYASLLWKWAWLIALCIVLAAGTAYYVSSRQAPTYRGTSTLLINQASTTVQDYTALLTGTSLAKTYAEMLTKRPVMEQVAREMGLAILPEALARKVKVTLVRDTQLISLQVLDDDPKLAMDLANRIPAVFAQQNEQMQMTRFASSKANLSEQMDVVSADIASLEGTLQSLRSASPPDQQEINRVTDQLTEYRTTYANLLRSFEDIRVQEARSLDTVTLVEPANLPTVPVGPKTKTNTMLAAVVGAMLAVGVGFLIEYLDDTIKTDTEVTTVLGLPTLGAILTFTSNEDAALLGDQPRSAVEAYRSLRTNIRFSSPDRKIKTILVTSSGSGEGKSTTVANLGAVFAKAGVSAAVVDADLRKPRQHKLFQVDNAKGLTTSLVADDVSQWNGDLKDATIPQLRLLTSGPLPPNPSELLSSQRMQSVIERLSREVDMVLIDAPPCLPVSDAGILASQVDGVLLVVESGKTRREAAVRAKESLEKVGGRILGVILTKIPARRPGYGYHSHYYDSRYYESSDGEPKRNRRHKSKSA